MIRLAGPDQREMYFLSVDRAFGQFKKAVAKFKKAVANVETEQKNALLVTIRQKDTH